MSIKFIPGPFGWCDPDKHYPPVLCSENEYITTEPDDPGNKQVRNGTIISGKLYKIVRDEDHRIRRQRNEDSDV